MMQSILSKKHLMEALKRAGLPYSYNSILDFERKGVIPRPESELGNQEYKGNRVYNQEEIEQIVAKVSAYIRSKDGRTAK